MARVAANVGRARHPESRRSDTESSGVVAAVACVAVALLLYLIAARVFGIDGDVLDGPFGAADAPPYPAVAARDPADRWPSA